MTHVAPDPPGRPDRRPDLRPDRPDDIAPSRLLPRLRARWAGGGLADRAVVAAGIALAAVLLGAFLFGVWHVLVGGVVRGNWRAGGFGIALALVTGALLAIGTGLARRRV